MARYAIGLMSEPDGPLSRLGSSILGYDAVTGLDAPFPDHPAYQDPLSLAWSAEPRVIGFAAVLKARFALTPHATADALKDEVAALALQQTPFSLDLTLSVVGHALALVAAEPSLSLQALADTCVRHFDPFRVALSPEDRERRHPDTLIQRQVDNLDTWGDPYVFEDFQFHMPLTGDLNPAGRQTLEPVLQEILTAASPLRLTADALVLLVQSDPNGRFKVQARCPFGA